MFDIKKLNTDIGNKIVITKDDVSLGILLSYENDLYLSLFGENNPSTFNIDLSDGDVYCITDNLYNNIKNIKYFYEENLNDIEADRINNFPSENILFNNGVIDYHSDDEDYERSSRLIISKEKRGYLLKIIPSKDLFDNSVVMSSVNCRYGNAIFPFMNFYNDLNNYDLKTRKLTK